MKNLQIHVVGLFVFIVGVSLFAAKPKANQTNPDDMWVTSPVPELPTMVTHHTFRSASMKREVGFCFYQPPGYEKDAERRYPVIYHLHGTGGNETRSVYSASRNVRMEIDVDGCNNAGVMPPSRRLERD